MSSDFMKGKNAIDELVSDGWREYPNQSGRYARCFYKRFETPTRCFGNSEKQGLQIQIKVYEHRGRSASMELELCAGLTDETWLSLVNYSLPRTVKEVTALIPRMLAVWEAANKFQNPKFNSHENE